MRLQHRAHLGSPSRCCSRVLAWQRRLAARSRGGRRRHRVSSRRRSTWDRRRWRWPAAAPGRTAVLVFTMPFWTVLLAWPVLGERVRGMQWLAIAFAFAGLTLVVEPWHWEGDLESKVWAVLSGFGWACGTIATKYFQRARRLRHAQFHRLADADRSPAAVSAAARCWRCRKRSGAATYVGLLLWTGASRRRSASCCGSRCCAFLPAGHRVAQHARHSGDRAPLVDGGLRRAAVGQRMDRHRLHRRRSRDPERCGRSLDARRGETRGATGNARRRSRAVDAKRYARRQWRRALPMTASDLSKLRIDRSVAPVRARRRRWLWPALAVAGCVRGRRLVRVRAASGRASRRRRS